MTTTQSPHTVETSGPTDGLLNADASSPVRPYGCGRPAISETPAVEQVTEAVAASLYGHLDYNFRWGTKTNWPDVSQNVRNKYVEAAESVIHLTTAARQPEVDQPAAWSFQLAGSMINGEYCGWGPTKLSFECPNVPEGSIRNLQPLYARQPSAPSQDALRDALDGADGIALTPNGSGGHKVVVNFPDHVSAERFFRALDDAPAASPLPLRRRWSGWRGQ